ncbi:hypothetical protein [Saccharospirillum impatiens]|uniref:hypothetical protein n=1 Tax=Saccharospirillum impatiens TaxID=169438 RepID=UPI0003F568B1|nr:hypothetical protein [Saccharospirillum impatiens]
MTHFPPRLSPGNARWLPALTAMALATGCATTGSDRFIDAPALVSGEGLQSELNTSSPTNLNNGARYSAHWFCATDAEPLAFYRFQAPFAAELTLFNDQGWLIDQASVNPETSDGVTILMGPDAGQCSLLVVNGTNDEAYGPYRLIDQAIAGRTDTLGTDQSLVGSLATDNSPTRYPLSIDSPTQISFTLNDASRSLGMQLTGPAVNAEATACGDSSLTLDAYLEPGDYELVLQPDRRPTEPVDEYDYYETETPLCSDALVDEGRFYQLDTASTTLPDGIRNGGLLEAGETLSGLMLSAEGNRYTLELEHPSEVVFSLGSEDFDTMLSITGDNVQLDNDDYGDGTDSQVSSILMPGSYTVTAMSYESYPVDGIYTLNTQVTPFEGDLRNSGEIAPGSSLIGMRTDNDNRYTLTIDEPSEVSIALNSVTFDTTLALSGNGLDMSDDDGGGDTNSLITTILQPGTYSLTVGAYSGNGLYDLTVNSSEVQGELMNSGTLRAGDIVYGDLQMGSSLTYTITLDAARTVSIDAVSSAVDTLITLVGPGLSLENDDGGDGTNSRVEEFLPAGTYTLEVRGYSGSESGQIRIEVQMDLSDAQS